MAEHDIDLLLRLLREAGSEAYDAALTALVAERDALQKRVAELESQPPASDRDKAMERWMDQVTAMLCHSMTHSHDAKQELVTRCDKAIDAMRKGGGA